MSLKLQAVSAGRKHQRNTPHCPRDTSQHKNTTQPFGACWAHVGDAGLSLACVASHLSSCEALSLCSRCCVILGDNWWRDKQWETQTGCLVETLCHRCTPAVADSINTALQVLSMFWTNVLPVTLTQRSFKVIWARIHKTFISPLRVLLSSSF